MNLKEITMRFRKEESVTDCKTTQVPVHYRGTRRFIAYCDATGDEGPIIDYECAKRCKAKECWNYRELDLKDEPEWFGDVLDVGDVK